MKYVNYDKDTGKILGYYDDTITDIIPVPNIKITDEQWENAIKHNYNYYDAKTNTLSKKDFRTLEELKQDKKSTIKGALEKYLSVYHLSNNINVINSLQEQNNNLNSLLFSQMALKSPQWEANTNYKVNDVVYVDDVLLLCVKTGTSDSDAPTPPNEFGVAVTDNTAKWAKLGFLVKTDKGRVYFTPQEIIQMSEEATAILHDALLKYNALKDKIKQATTKEELEEIKWN